MTEIPRHGARGIVERGGRESDLPRERSERRDGPTAAKSVRVGQVRVDLETWEISRQGYRSRLQEKPFRVLAALTERPGELVTRAELRERLWPDGTIVDFDNNLNSAVASLRTAFGDTAKAPRVIETLPRLGYRLIASVSFEEPRSAEVERAGGVDAPRARRLDPRWLAAVAGVALVLSAAVVRRGAWDNPPADSAGRSPVASGELVPSAPAARQAYQNGLYLFARGAVGDLTLALESFEEAVRLQPGFAPAHVQIAETLMRMSFAGGLELRQGLTQAREAARRAIALDPTSASAHRLLALGDLHLDWDFAAAGDALESALRLDPRDANNYLAVATFLTAGGCDDSPVRAVRRAVDLDPASSMLQADLGYFLVAAGHHAEALAVTEKLLELEPNTVHVLRNRMLAAEQQGLFEHALASAKRVMELRGADEAEIGALARDGARAGLTRFRRWRLATYRARADPSFFHLAVRQAALRQDAAAIASLYQAYERREPWLVYLRSYIQFDALQDEPRFLAFVNQLGFPRPTDAVVARVENLL